MSDGVFETARWKDIEACLSREGSSQEKAFEIIELINQSPEEEKDNAAVVVLRVR